MERILLMSDLHYCHINWYGRSSHDRLVKLAADVCEEYKREPFPFILILGDVSLDHWVCPPYGSVIGQGLSNTSVFLEKIVPLFPCPVYLIPGNHEQYGNAGWRKITGFDRQYFVEYGDELIFMLDTFGGNLDPVEHSDGTYSGVDTAFVRRVLAEHPGKHAILCAHDFYYETESDDFAELVRSDAVDALFAGHTHVSRVYDMGERYANKKLIRTGQYSYSSEKPPLDCMWGFRELYFKENGLESAYITPGNTITISGTEHNQAYGRQDRAVTIR